MQGREPKEPQRIGLFQISVGGGYFIPNTSPPTFEFRFRMKYREILTIEAALLDFCTRRLPGILTFGTLVLEPFRKRFLLFEISAGAWL